MCYWKCAGSSCKFFSQFWEKILMLSHQSQSGVLQHSLAVGKWPGEGCLLHLFLTTRQRTVINCITQCGDKQSCAKCLLQTLESWARGQTVVVQRASHNFKTILQSELLLELHMRFTARSWYWEPTGGFAPCLHCKGAARHAVCRDVQSLQPWEGQEVPSR